MKRKKTDEQKHEQMMMKCREFYDKHKNLLNQNASLEANISLLINEASQIKFKTDLELDMLVVNSLIKANTILSKPISDDAWKFLINKAFMKKRNTLTEKRMNKCAAMLKLHII